MPEVPSDLQSITTAWLSAALQAPVQSHRIADAHAGTTGRAVLEIEYAQPVDLPGRLFVKLPPNDDAQRRFVTSSGMGRREALFYDVLSAHMPVRVPRSYYAASDDAGERYIMLLEHLEDSGCTFKNARTYYSLEYLRQVLSCFARLHATFWQSPRFDADLDWVQPPLQHDIAMPLVTSALARYSATMPAVFTQMGELYLEEADAIHRLWKRGAQTLIHGDVHDGNLFMDAGEPGFLDWAVLARGPGLRDVGYFLAGTLRPDDQTAFAELLAYYRDQLAANGVSPPTQEELWAQLQWHAAYVWLGATVTLAMGDAWQPQKYVMSSMGRLHGALEKLDSVQAIRASL